MNNIDYIINLAHGAGSGFLIGGLAGLISGGYTGYYLGQYIGNKVGGFYATKTGYPPESTKKKCAKAFSEIGMILASLSFGASYAIIGAKIGFSTTLGAIACLPLLPDSPSSQSAIKT